MPSLSICLHDKPATMNGILFVQLPGFSCCFLKQRWQSSWYTCCTCVHRLQRSNKESPSSRERTAAFGLILQPAAATPTTASSMPSAALTVQSGGESPHGAVLLPSTGTNTISSPSSASSATAIRKLVVLQNWSCVTDLRCTGLSHSSWTFWPLKWRPLLCLDTRGMNCPVMGHQISEEWIPHFWLAILCVQVSFYSNDCSAVSSLFSKPWTVILSFSHCIVLSFSCLPL